MKTRIVSALCIAAFPAIIFSCNVSKAVQRASLPVWMKGNFTDDYGEKYSVSDSVFAFGKAYEYRIIRIDTANQFILAKNGAGNASDKDLFTRIDYMTFKNMAPFEWGFCLTVYNARDTMAALAVPAADRTVPKKGCNGYPFSRMKRTVP